MSQKMFQGRTLNHLSWVMVNATDFATPRSNMSALTKIMVNGKLQTTSLVYFVSSGTGSMVGGDIKHVGASVTGVYTVALAKGDLSDASAAWYDQYIFTLTGTSAAQQVLVCEGILATANASNLSALISDTYSMAKGNSDYLSKLSDIISNAYSAAAQGTSKLVKVYSMLSDTFSTMNSQFVYMSDAVSNAYSAAVLGNTNALAGSSKATKIYSQASNINSQLIAGTFAVGASVTSDIASNVWAHATGVATASRALAGASRALLVQSRLSDFDSRLVSDVSDILSAVRGSSDYLSKLSDMVSKAQIGAVAGSSKATKIYSMLSDTLSTMNSQFVWSSDAISNAYSAAVQGASQILLTKTQATAGSSKATKIYSMLSDFDSDFQSRVPKLVANNSQLSDLASDIKSAVGAITVSISASDISDIASAVTAGLTGVTASDLKNIANKVWSDFGSKVGRTPSDLWSDILSKATSTRSMVAKIPKTDSDLIFNATAVGNIKAGLATQSNLDSIASDVKSAVVAGTTQATAGSSKATKIYSMLSDTLSTMNSQFVYLSAAVSDVNSLVKGNSDYMSKMSDMWSNTRSAADQINSRVLLVQSRLSDLDSRLVSDVSDILSTVRGNSDYLSKLSDIISNAYSAAAQGSSKATKIYSLLSDTQSDLQSRIPKQVASASALSDLTSDLKSAIAGITVALTASDISDIASAVAAQATGVTASDIKNIAEKVWSDFGSKVGRSVSDVWSDALVQTAKLNSIYSLLSNVDSALTSQLALETNAFDKLNSWVSDVDSALTSQFVTTNSQLDVNVITVNDIYSLLSAVNSDFQVRVPKEVANKSQVSDLASDLKSAMGNAGASASALSDIYSLLSDVRSAVGAVTVDGNAIADALLDRDMGAGVDTGTATKRTPRQALRFLRNKWTVVGASLSVKKENDVDESWNASLMTTPGASPVTGNDPQGP